MSNFANFTKEFPAPQYLCWRYEKKANGQRTKVPYIAGTNRRARSTDRRTWCSAETAVSAYQQPLGLYDGIGFALFGYVGIDMDGCRNDKGELSPLAQEVLAACTSYAEISPSGRGVHVICKSSITEFADGTASAVDKELGLEIYLGKQYFTCTGNVLYTDRRCIDCSEGLLQLVKKYFPQKLDRNSQGEPQDAPALPEAAVSLTDAEVLAAIRRSAQAEKFSRLHDEGDFSDYLKEDGSPDHSSGDIAEMEMLSYYTQNEDQVVRIFCTSALARAEKGLEKRQKYLYDTARKAIARVLARGTVYDPQTYYKQQALAALTAEANLDTLKELFFYELTDAGRADRVRAMAGDSWLYSSNARNWYQWTGQRWLENAGSGLSELMIRLFRQLLALIGAGEITFSGSGRDQDKQREAYQRFYKDSCNVPKIRAAKALLADYLDVDGGNEGPVFDRSVNLLNTPGGTLNLDTGEYHAHRREDLITKITGCAAGCTYHGSLWEKTLNEVLPDAGTQQYFQRFCGYCLNGDVSEEKFIIAYGEGGAGKGTLLEAIAAAMGDYATQIPVDLLLQSKAGTGEAPAAQLLSLRGKRMALCSESGLGRRLNEAKIKWITGGDTLTARGLYARKPTNWLPTHKVIIQSNYMPQIADAMDSGIRRRLVIIPFRASGFTVNPRLKAQLKAPDELQNVLAWLIDGHQKWRLFGLGEESQEMLAAKGRYYDEQDLLQHWLDECCIMGAGYRMHLTTGKEAFNRWLTDGRTTQESVGLKRFRADMEAHGFRIERKNRGNYFIGVTLKGFIESEICNPDLGELLG